MLAVVPCAIAATRPLPPPRRPLLLLPPPAWCPGVDKRKQRGPGLGHGHVPLDGQDDADSEYGVSGLIVGEEDPKNAARHGGERKQHL